MYALGSAILPRSVRDTNPICIKYGSYTSSIVSISSPVDAASDSIPTGPPLYCSINTWRTFLSVLSSPSSSISSLFNASFEIYKSIGYTITKNAEGVTKNNFYGTHIIGPILVRNPEILRYFVSRLIQEKNIELEDSITKIDTEFELKARDEFINNYYKNQKPKKLC